MRWELYCRRSEVMCRRSRQILYGKSLDSNEICICYLTFDVCCQVTINCFAVQKRRMSISVLPGTCYVHQATSQ